MNLMLRLILGAYCSILLCVSCKHKREIDLPVAVSPYDSTTLSKCFSCSAETPVDTLTNMAGKIIRVPIDPINGFDYAWAISISKDGYESESYILSQDSILVPCPMLSPDLLVYNKKIILSGVTTSCNKLFSCPTCRFLFGRKVVVTKIQAK